MRFRSWMVPVALFYMVSLLWAYTFGFRFGVETGRMPIEHHTVSLQEPNWFCPDGVRYQLRYEVSIRKLACVKLPDRSAGETKEKILWSIE